MDDKEKQRKDQEKKREANQLQSKIDSKERQRREVKAKIAENEEKIRRLEEARLELKQLKHVNEEFEKEDKRTLKKSGEWKGSTWDSFASNQGDRIKKADKEYIKAIDAAHDQINWEKLRLIAINDSHKGLLGSLNTAIRGLETALQNLFT